MKEFLISLIENKITYKYFSIKMKKQYKKIKTYDYKKFYAFKIFMNDLKNILKNRKEVV
jgi:hypothetical protein